MGNSDSRFHKMYNFNTENTDRANNESHIYRDPLYPDSIRDFKYGNLQQLFTKAFENNPSNDALIIERKLDSEGNPTDERIEYSYGQIRQEAEWFGRGVLDLDLVPWKEEYRDFKLRFMGIYAKNSYRYFLQDFGCVMHNIVSVPIYDTLGEEATIFAFENTRMESLCLTANHLDNMVKFKSSGDLPHLKTVIIIDEENVKEDAKEKAEKAGLKFFLFSEIIEKGKASQITEWVPVKDDDIYCFSYTSGTTGTPKGAMLSHKNTAVTIQSLLSVLSVNNKDRHLNYLPMAHIMERLLSLIIFYGGAKIHLYCGNVRKLKDDLAYFKPTIFVSVPRLYNRFYDVMQDKIKATDGTMKGKLIRKAIATKLENLEKTGEVKHTFYDALVFNKFKAVLGGEVRIMITASAPLNLKVANFFKIAISCPMMEAYGQTEGTGGEFCTNKNDTGSGYVGGILSQNEFKLVDVPDMNYTSEDVDPETGLVTPRGEIWVRGQGIIPGYYKNDKKNEETFTKDGWLKSGDIGKLVPPSNHLVIIDRKKNIFKLSQGEYIAPEKLEGSYKTCTPLFTDVFIYGDSLKSSILAVITIEKDNMRKVAELVGVDSSVSDEDLFSNADFEKGVLELIKAKAKESKFNRLEIPRGVLFNSAPFAELGLVTTSFKPKRNDIKNYFIERLNKRYESLN
jgi:long-chain acyl-CoA synthetase